MSISATKTLSFCAAHRLLGHEGLCVNLHGHNYRVEIEVRPEEGRSTDKMGRVVDFSLIKKRIGGWIDRNWDHATILEDIDPMAAAILASVTQKDKGGAPTRVFTMKCAPTAENMARHLLKVCTGDKRRALDRGEVARIRVYETETCWAEAKL